MTPARCRACSADGRATPRPRPQRAFEISECVSTAQSYDQRHLEGEGGQSRYGIPYPSKLKIPERGEFGSRQPLAVKIAFPLRAPVLYAADSAAGAESILPSQVPAARPRLPERMKSLPALREALGARRSLRQSRARSRGRKQSNPFFACWSPRGRRSPSISRPRKSSVSAARSDWEWLEWC
jgi:hypothetical protein